MLCNKCNSNIDIIVNYCPYCGNKLTTTESSFLKEIAQNRPLERYWICSFCGYRNDDDLLRCWDCNTKRPPNSSPIISPSNDQRDKITSHIGQSITEPDNTKKGRSVFILMAILCLLSVPIIIVVYHNKKPIAIVRDEIAADNGNLGNITELKKLQKFRDAAIPLCIVSGIIFFALSYSRLFIGGRKKYHKSKQIIKESSRTKMGKNIFIIIAALCFISVPIIFMDYSNKKNMLITSDRIAYEAKLNKLQKFRDTAIPLCIVTGIIFFALSYSRLFIGDDEENNGTSN